MEGVGDEDFCVGDAFASFASFFNNDNSVFMVFGSMTVPKSSIVSKFAELLEMETIGVSVDKDANGSSRGSPNGSVSSLLFCDELLFGAIQLSSSSNDIRSGASSESSSMATIPLRSMVFVECSAFVSFVVLLLPDAVTEMPFGIFALLLLVLVTAPVT